MKMTLVTLSVLCILAACGGPKPEDVVKGFCDAVAAGDGEKAVGYLTQEAIDMANEQIEAAKADTSGYTLDMMAALLGADVTREQLMSMDGRQIIALQFGSDLMKQVFTGATVGQATMTGETATVMVTLNFMGQTQEVPFQLIRDGGSWKISQSLEGM